MFDRGKLAVLSMFALAIGAAAFAWWWNYRRGERCLAFYGSEAAALIRTAPTVEILELDPASTAEEPTVARRIDISRAPGLLNARAALLDDASFVWGGKPQPASAKATHLVRFATADRELRLHFDSDHQSLEILPTGKSAVLDAKTSAGWKQFLERHRAAPPMPSAKSDYPPLAPPTECYPSRGATIMFTFDDRKQAHEVQSRIRRILDRTVPNFPSELQANRVDDRYNRTLPALLCAWESGAPVTDSCLFVVTRDISSEGIGVVLAQPFRAPQVLLGFWLDEEVTSEPWFFLGTSQGLRKIGGGYWTLGIQLTKFARSGCGGELAELAPLAKQLRPTAVPAELPGRDIEVAMP